MTSRRYVKVAFVVSLIALAGDSRAGAVSYYLTVDVPSKLGGTTYTTNQVVRSDNAAYILAMALPAGAKISALHRRPNGLWILVPSRPLLLGGTEYEPRDIVSYNGASFALAFDGSAAGIPQYARIDAIYSIGIGTEFTMSFDVPVNISGVEYGRSDLVGYLAGAFVLLWDAESEGVPPGSNVIGADRDSSGDLVLSFDVPTNLGGVDYMPGQLVRWTGAGFASYFADPAWPASAPIGDFSFVPSNQGAGSVPDGSSGSVPLTVGLAAGSLSLSWGSSCAPGDSDYEVYEGTLTSPFTYTHAAKLCTTAGATTASFAAGAGSAYYLVVPRNATTEGSYGRRSNGLEIPQGASACLTRLITLICP